MHSHHPFLLLSAVLASQTDIIERRDCLSSIFGPLIATSVNSIVDVLPARAEGATTATGPINDVGGVLTVTLPLEPCGGGVSCVRVTATGLNIDPGRSRPAFLPSSLAQPFRVYRTIVDTGSPYLVLSSVTGRDILSSGTFPVLPDPNQPLWRGQVFLTLLEEGLGVLGGTDAPFFFDDSPYPPTEEIYGSRMGQILWKSTPVRFRDPRLVSAAEERGNVNTVGAGGAGAVILGLMDEVLTQESGGSLLGLVKRSNPLTQKVNLRPTFLEQQRLLRKITEEDGRNDAESQTVGLLEIISFAVNFPAGELTLSSIPLIPRNAAHVLPLVDLRPQGDFVEHYACTVDEIILDGFRVNSKTLSNPLPKGRHRQIIAVFDTGLTGCLITQPFWDQLVLLGYAPSQCSQIQILVKEESSKTHTNSKDNDSDKDVVMFESSKGANKFFYLAPISLDWFDDETTAPFVIVLGQTFLSQGALTVDIDDRRATFL